MVRGAGMAVSGCGSGSGAGRCRWHLRSLFMQVTVVLRHEEGATVHALWRRQVHGARRGVLWCHRASSKPKLASSRTCVAMLQGVWRARWRCTPKEAVGSNMFQLAVQNGMQMSLAMAVVASHDQMFGKPSMLRR